MRIMFPNLGKIIVVPIVQFMKVIFQNIIDLEDFYDFCSTFCLGIWKHLNCLAHIFLREENVIFITSEKE